MQEFESIMAAGHLSREDLIEAEREMEILDRTFARHDYILLNELAHIGTSFSRGNYRAIGYRADSRPVDAPWRYGFSVRLVAADGFARTDRWLGKYTQETEKPWRSNTPLQEDMIREVSESPNTFEHHLVPQFSGSERPWREAR